MVMHMRSILRAAHHALVCACIVGTLTGCTENRRARTYGGANVNVAPGQRVVNATWKNANLWVLTRPLRTGEVPETLTFHEFSAWGIAEGTFVLHESAVQP